MFRTATACRACGLGTPQASTLKTSLAAGSAYAASEKLVPAFDLGIQPLANDFRQVGEEREGFAPLQVMHCPRCHNAQLSVVVNPKILYGHTYRYVTSTSQTMRRHFETIAQLIAEEAPQAGSLVEIGSNDGLLLEFFQQRGMRVLGVDPAANLVEKCRQRGLDAICAFWNKDIGQSVLSQTPDVILARHVFCHVDDWRDFIKGLELASLPETLIAIEVPYAKDMLERGEFDTIYHEHLDYFTVKAMSHLLRDSTLRLHRIIPLDIHGGALLVMLRQEGSQIPPHKSVSQYLNSEECGIEAWKDFGVRCRAKIDALKAFVEHAVNNGKRVAGYGASAKSTVWINACGFTRRHIAFVCDCTVEKQYRYIPGSDIPIADEGALTRELPDYAVCFAWNFFDECQAKEAIFARNGGKWIVPHPQIKVV